VDDAESQDTRMVTMVVRVQGVQHQDAFFGPVWWRKWGVNRDMVQDQLRCGQVPPASRKVQSTSRCSLLGQRGGNLSRRERAMPDAAWYRERTVRETTKVFPPPALTCLP